ncbi:MAG: hypothetical protein IJR99_11735 [Kiritimatiellae bacterium]|nr:hypothetical protein [Kiritimatiellia bacterium]
MNEDNFTQLAIRISTELGTLNANMTSVLSKIADHDERIRNLEVEKKTDDDSFKVIISQWLAKSLLLALATIATLSGSAGIIKQIFEK